MGKKQKSELKLKEDKKLKQVAVASKAINKKAKPAKKYAEKANANSEAGKNVPRNVKSAEKNLKKMKKGSDVIPANVSEAAGEMLAKKKAKKVAQKLKKQQLNKGDKDEKPKGKPNAQKAVKPKVEAKGAAKSPKKQQPKKEKVARTPPGPEEEAATVFVGNLPVNTKAPQLIRAFIDYAPIKSVRFRTASGRLIFKHKMRKEAGGLIAYVVLKDAETAERALALNNSEFKGNHLRVTLATDKGPADVKRTVLVGNLKYSANEEKLREIFSSCGEIDYVRCLQASPAEIASKTSRNLKAGCKGVAYICFKSPEAVGLALELKDTLLDERPINVERYTLKKQGAFKARKEAGQQAQPEKKGKNTNKNTITENEDGDEKKKPVFHGVKIDNIKKKNKVKTDKKMKALAKKIAPKTLLQK